MRSIDLDSDKKLDKVSCNLTCRQQEVFDLMTKNKFNKEIACQFKISEQAVIIHCMAIFKTLGVSSRTQAIQLGQQLFDSANSH